MSVNWTSTLDRSIPTLIAMQAVDQKADGMQTHGDIYEIMTSHSYLEVAVRMTLLPS